MSQTAFDTITIVDWSARSKPSPKRPTKDAIFWCTARDGSADPVAYAQTRAEARYRLIALIQAEQAAGRRHLLGFDFPFGYPRGVAEHLTGTPSALALWDWLDERITDQADNANNRYDVASEMNRAYPGTGPAWGRPASWNHPDVPTTAKARRGDHPPERRRADAQAKGAKTVWQLAYAGSVGGQILVGLPVLNEIRATTGAQVWPFDTGLNTPKAQTVLAEIYPSLLQHEAHAARRPDEPLDAAQVRTNALAFAHLSSATLARCFAPDLPEPDRTIVAREEAWILGLGHERDLRSALGSASFILERKSSPKASRTLNHDAVAP